MAWPAHLVIAGVVASAAVHYVARCAYAYFSPSLSAAQCEAAAHATVCLVHNVLVGVVAAAITPWHALLFDTEPLWHDLVPGFDVPAGMSAGFFAYDLWKSGLWQPFSWLLVLHHVLSFACWTCAVWVSFAQPWIAYCLATELSSIFLSTRTLIGIVGDKTGGAYGSVTALFGFSFLLIRTLPVPWLARHWLHHPPLGSAACGPTRTAQLMGWMSVLPLFLNSYWTVALLRKQQRDRAAARRDPARKQRGT